MSFIQHLRTRGDHREQPPPPWHLHDKLTCYDFCDLVGVPRVGVLRSFDHPEQIDLDGLPDEFVLKPAYHSSSIGVMVLTKDGDVFHDAMSRKDYTAAEIRSRQTKIFDEHPRTSGKLTIVEEKVEDAAGAHIPEDYKAYCFQGEVAFVLRMDRNHGRPRVSWFDGNFAPITDDRIDTNERYLTLTDPVRPDGWEALLHLARRASTAIPTPFVSIDMYSTTRGPVLGEVTLVPGGFYFGKYFVLSAEEDARTGRMWDDALVRLGRRPRPEPGSGDS